MQVFFQQLLATLKTFTFKDFIDVAIVAMILYLLFRLFRHTRAGQLIKGIIVLLIVYAIAHIFDLAMVTVILDSVLFFWAPIFVILFQPELRLGLERLGRSNKRLFNIVSNTIQDQEDSLPQAISDVADTSAIFSKSKTGALIVFERESKLNDIANTGTMLNSTVSPALLGNLFYNKAPLHDGACIIRDGKILAAGCILPLTNSLNVSQALGTRHRAAIGITEESDAVVVVVSEETGSISIALNGMLTRDYTRDGLYKRLTELLINTDKNQSNNLFAALFNKRKEKKHEQE